MGAPMPVNCFLPAGRQVVRTLAPGKQCFSYNKRPCYMSINYVLVQFRKLTEFVRRLYCRALTGSLYSDQL